MAITEKNEEQLVALEKTLRAQGASFEANELAGFGKDLDGKKLKDAFRAAIYIESLHQNQHDLNWDKQIPVGPFMETLRAQL